MLPVGLEAFSPVHGGLHPEAAAFQSQGGHASNGLLVIHHQDVPVAEVGVQRPVFPGLHRADLI